MVETLTITDGYKGNVFFKNEVDRYLISAYTDQCRRVDEEEYRMYIRLLNKNQRLNDSLIEIGRIFDTHEEARDYVAAVAALRAIENGSAYDTEIRQRIREKKYDDILATNVHVRASGLLAKLDLEPRDPPQKPQRKAA